jgi:putative toxin-antitoxin system antitoxin component (TIGR02293 family)
MQNIHVENDSARYHPRYFWRDVRARCPSEATVLPTAKPLRFTGLKRVEGNPVEVLLRGREWGEDPMFIIRYTQHGFELPDVVNLISTSELYQEGELVQMITGKSIRTVRRLLKDSKPFLLSQQQSMVAFQYAHVLEVAIEVFGGQAEAEEWLRKPTKWLNGYKPIELVENPFGYQVVDAYLHRTKYGVYQ